MQRHDASPSLDQPLLSLPSSTTFHTSQVPVLSPLLSPYFHLFKLLVKFVALYCYYALAFNLPSGLDSQFVTVVYYTGASFAYIDCLTRNEWELYRLVKLQTPRPESNICNSIACQQWRCSMKQASIGIR